MTMRIDWMRGCATALVTPFLKDGSVDEECFRRLVERQIKGGVNLLVPCGTTGESVTMNEAERLTVIRATVEVAKRLKVSDYRAYELARQGTLKSVRLGKSVRVKPSAVDDYLLGHGA